MIDSHAHLHLCEGPDEELLARAAAAGVTRVLTVGIDDDSCRAALAAAHADPRVFAAVGRHPNAAQELDVELLARLAGDPRCVAIGETGLDYYRAGAPRAVQRHAFEAQIELARALGKPLIIHTREAEEDTLAILRERAGGVQVLLHCFSMAQRVEECLAEGWWVSFAGNVTYPKAEALARAAEQVPVERLLVETDAPYLAPAGARRGVPRRGMPNEPAAVIETARFVAERRGVSYDELERGVERCAAELFRW